MQYLTNLNNSGMHILKFESKGYCFCTLLHQVTSNFMKGRQLSTLFCTLMPSVKWLPVCLPDQNIQISLHSISDEVRFLYTYVCN